MGIQRPATVPGSLPPGSLIAGRYVVVRTLGHGGMGTVFEVEHEAIGRRFALKVIRVESPSEQVERRFAREARALGCVESPRVAGVTDFGHEPGLGFFYVMEYVEGETLEQRIERVRVIRADEAVPMAIALCEAIQDVHDAGVVHRDVKPANVALCSVGPIPVRLLDFGLAVSVDSSFLERVTQSRTLLGSLYYMAPEVLRDEPVTRAVDLYALGVVLFEMLTGRPPFDSESAAALIGMHLESSPPSMEEVAPELDVPVPLEAIVARLLDKDPEQRFASATAVARALQSVVL